MAAQIVEQMTMAVRAGDSLRVFAVGAGDQRGCLVELVCDGAGGLRWALVGPGLRPAASWEGSIKVTRLGLYAAVHAALSDLSVEGGIYAR